ncbi:MAG: cysteine hydrolase [Erysipelotrichaceae bacterium]|nr:cysteine hydrolase [Erysipelotrichaceae bacterium]
MKDILLVIDMQNDFVFGPLSTDQAREIVQNVKEKVLNFKGDIYFTRDTHFENYLSSQEGKKLPVTHCIKDTEGWQIIKDLDTLRKTEPIDKVTFGSSKLVDLLVKENEKETINSITLIGVCTDICVISNAMIIKAFLPETEILVDASCCAGVTVESHNNALEAMKCCQITIINQDSIS